MIPPKSAGFILVLCMYVVSPPEHGEEKRASHHAGEFVPIEELKARREQMESWSQLCLDNLDALLNKRLLTCPGRNGKIGWDCNGNAGWAGGKCGRRAFLNNEDWQFNLETANASRQARQDGGSWLFVSVRSAVCWVWRVCADPGLRLMEQRQARFSPPYVGLFGLVFSCVGSGLMFGARFSTGSATTRDRKRFIPTSRGSGARIERRAGSMVGSAIHRHFVSLRGFLERRFHHHRRGYRAAGMAQGPPCGAAGPAAADRPGDAGDGHRHTFASRRFGRCIFGIAPSRCTGRDTRRHNPDRHHVLS